MNTKVHKIGNSLSIYIPKRIADKAGLVRGTPVLVRSVGRKILVEPESHRETLQDLLKGLNTKNRQPLVNFGPDVGAEIID